MLFCNSQQAKSRPIFEKESYPYFPKQAIKLTYQTTGCCGMAGIYGHESRNQKTSRKLYDMSWKNLVEAPENKGKLVATGYSCRSQSKRLGSMAIPHPVSQLLALMVERQTSA